MSLIKSLSRDFLYLLMTGFVLIGSFGMMLNQEQEGVEQVIKYEKRENLDLLPRLRDESKTPILSAQGVVVIDLDSRVVLYEKNPNLPLLPASTTKIMTALVAMENYPLEQEIVFNGDWVEGQKMGLVEGERVRVRELLDGLLIFSANDAAETLAIYMEGGRERFVELMNKKAQFYGMLNTYFENPSGLDGARHRSTARDMAILAELAMTDPLFAEIVGTKSKTVSSVDEINWHRLTNINELLGEVEGVLGVKTGWTESARENLITYVDRDGKRVLIVVMGSQDRFGETKELIDWVFEAYRWEEIQVPLVSEPLSG